MSFKFSVNSRYREMLLVSAKKPIDTYKTNINSFIKDTSVDRKEREEKPISDNISIQMRLGKSITKIYKTPIIYKKMQEKKISLPNIHLSNSNQRRNLLENSKSSLSLKKKKKHRVYSVSTIKSKNINEIRRNDTIDISLSFIKKTQVIKKGYKSVLAQYACKSLPGRNNNGFIKTNQDAYLLMTKIYGLNNFSLFGVFDGHGVNGHLVSKYLKDFFMGHYIQQETFFPNSIISTTLKENKIKEQLTHSFFVNSYNTAENKLSEQKIDMNLSGSTGIQLIHIEDTLYCVNTGDSRAIYINEDNDCFQISRDHKPILFQEKERIENNGGVIRKSRETGPFRIWEKDEDLPGLAISRSFGDFMAKNLGVICEPEIYELSIINKKIRAVVIASDGLWEYLTNSNVKALIAPFRHKNDCVGASKKLVEEAHNSWVKNGLSSDDITVIVLFFKVESKTC